MSCRGHDVGILHRVVQQSGSYQSGRVGHVDHEQCTHFVGYLAHALVVPFAAVCRASADDELRFVLDGQLFHLVVVNAAGLAVEVVAYRIV